jgi:hypothetical protein
MVRNQWGSDRSLIVKAVKKNSFFNQSDIHVGDELLPLRSGACVSNDFSLRQ